MEKTDDFTHLLPARRLLPLEPRGILGADQLMLYVVQRLQLEEDAIGLASQMLLVGLVGEQVLAALGPLQCLQLGHADFKWLGICGAR